jgi:hypothetical protein
MRDDGNSARSNRRSRNGRGITLASAACVAKRQNRSRAPRLPLNCSVPFEPTESPFPTGGPLPDQRRASACRSDVPALASPHSLRCFEARPPRSNRIHAHSHCTDAATTRKVVVLGFPEAAPRWQRKPLSHPHLQRQIFFWSCRASRTPCTLRIAPPECRISTAKSSTCPASHIWPKGQPALHLRA